MIEEIEVSNNETNASINEESFPSSSQDKDVQYLIDEYNKICFDGINGNDGNISSSTKK